jgi:hypothetical protein
MYDTQSISDNNHIFPFFIQHSVYNDATGKITSLKFIKYLVKYVEKTDLKKKSEIIIKSILKKD